MYSYQVFVENFRAYECRFRRSLNELIYFGYQPNVDSFSKVFHGFPNMLLFINLKKSFSNEVFASFLLLVLKSIYCFNHGDCLNFRALCTLVTFKPKSMYSCRFL